MHTDTPTPSQITYILCIYVPISVNDMILVHHLIVWFLPKGCSIPPLFFFYLFLLYSRNLEDCNRRKPISRPSVDNNDVL